MTFDPELLLVGAVVAVGVLHTLVPDHWIPIALIARQQHWSRRETVQAALRAGAGHVVSTLLIGLLVWIAGVAVAQRFGTLVSTLSSIALIAFGSWIALTSLRSLRESSGHGHSHSAGNTGHQHDDPREHEPAHSHSHADGHGHAALPGGGVATLLKHVHVHRHERGSAHEHLHDHRADTWHEIVPRFGGQPPLHDDHHQRSPRTALLLILGSSPMVEGLPAFFAAGKFGAGLIAVMSLAFAVSTIATYVALCVYATAGLQRLHIGPFEQYGEVLSGGFIVVVGLTFLIFPIV